jgi:hypothetical protein
MGMCYDAIMNVYLIVKRDEKGTVSEERVPLTQLVSTIQTLLIVGGVEILAIIRL